MGTEIERKFLIDVDRRPLLIGGTLIKQGYLSTEPVVRVRSYFLLNGQITIKGPGKLERAEFNYEIPQAEAIEMMALTPLIIVKTRYVFPIDGKMWEIDQFHEKLEGLWLAEIELSSKTEYIVKPMWIGKEVTEDPRYANVNLAQTQTIPV